MLPTFVLVSRMQFAQRYRDNTTSFSGVSSSRIEGMVGGALVRNSTFRVGLGVGGTRLKCQGREYLFIGRNGSGKQTSVRGRTDTPPRDNNRETNVVTYETECDKDPVRCLLTVQHMSNVFLVFTDVAPWKTHVPNSLTGTYMSVY